MLYRLNQPGTSELFTFLDRKSVHTLYISQHPQDLGLNPVIKLINISAAKWMNI